MCDRIYSIPYVICQSGPIPGPSQLLRNKTMPQAADIVINNGAGTTKTFKLLSPAAGYGSAAKWALKEGAISAVFPKITASARVNDAAKTKKAWVTLDVPSSYTDVLTGLTHLSSGFQFNGTFTVPDDFPESLKNDAIAFTTNLMANAIIQAMGRDGEPAT